YVVDAPDTPNRTGSDAAPRVSAHRDDGFPVAFGVAVLLGDAQGLGDEGLDDLWFGDGLDDLPLHEDLSLAVAGRHREVGLPRLARAVHDASHHRDPQRHFQPLQARRDLVGQFVDVHLCPPARRAGDDLQLAWTEVQRLQDLVAALHLLDR